MLGLDDSDSIPFDDPRVQQQLDELRREITAREQKRDLQLVMRVLRQLPEFYRKSQYKVERTERDVIVRFKYLQYGVNRIDSFLIKDDRIVRLER